MSRLRSCLAAVVLALAFAALAAGYCTGRVFWWSVDRIAAARH